MSAVETAEKGFKPEVIEGGKAATAPKDPYDAENWLGELDKGTVFLYRKRASHPGFHLDAFQVVFQWGDATLLGRHQEEGPDYLEYVDSKLFSNLHERFKVILTIPKNKEEIVGEQNDEHSDRSD